MIVTLTDKQQMREEVRAELEALALAGSLTPDTVIEQARDKTTSLHQYGGFNWNVREAALEHWRDHARGLISSYYVTVVVSRPTGRTVTQVEVRQQQFVRPPATPVDVQLYKRYEDLKRSPTQLKALVARDLGIARTYLYKTLASADELSLSDDVWALINTLNKIGETVGLIEA